MRERAEEQISNMWSDDKTFFGANTNNRGFLTPQPPSWKKTQTNLMTSLPMSERKTLSPSGCFHVLHKVPASDSPYGRAKHVQLIDKDPSKAISLFWAAINAGDRVDSALKDMAVVMKQLNRSDEAIEAIKSFRHLCLHDSQESLDNVLVELYKRSGRVEEEIEILQNKLKKIDEGTVFGGKRTKIARSQGKKVQITIEQEKSRILGNLAWAYLQQHNYGIAEQHYRKALVLEADKNKQCNLAICLMHMNRLSEAKSLLEEIKASAGNELEMDESYAKSYERAHEMLLQFQSKSMLESQSQSQPQPQPQPQPLAHEAAADKGRDCRKIPLKSNRDRSLKEASFFLPRNDDNNTNPGSGFIMDSRRLPYTTTKHWQGKKDNSNGYGDHSLLLCTPNGVKSSNLLQKPSPLTMEKWRKDSSSCLESPCDVVGSAHKKLYANSGSAAASRKSSEALLFTQPRRCSWGFNSADKRGGSGGRWGEDNKARNYARKLSFEQTENNIGKSENSASAENGRQEYDEGVLLTQPCRKSLLWLNNRDQRKARPCTEEESVGKQLSFEKTKNLNGVSSKDHDLQVEVGLEKPAATTIKKSWADMVEEEEEESEFNDENLNSNITQQIESLDDMKGGGGGGGASENRNVVVSSRRSRLQVFRDITSP